MGFLRNVEVDRTVIALLPAGSIEPCPGKPAMNTTDANQEARCTQTRGREEAPLTGKARVRSAGQNLHEICICRGLDILHLRVDMGAAGALVGISQKTADGVVHRIETKPRVSIWD
jgi:hypothetical protein